VFFSYSAQPEQQEHVIVESKQPTMKKSVKRKAKSKFTMKKSRKTKVAVEKEKDGTKCANCNIMRMRIGFRVISGMIGFAKTWMRRDLKL